MFAFLEKLSLTARIRREFEENKTFSSVNMLLWVVSHSNPFSFDLSNLLQELLSFKVQAANQFMSPTMKNWINQSLKCNALPGIFLRKILFHEPRCNLLANLISLKMVKMCRNYSWPRISSPADSKIYFPSSLTRVSQIILIKWVTHESNAIADFNGKVEHQLMK